jgi:hypothetical protein
MWRAADGAELRFFAENCVGVRRRPPGPPRAGNITGDRRGPHFGAEGLRLDSPLARPPQASLQELPPAVPLWFVPGVPLSIPRVALPGRLQDAALLQAGAAQRAAATSARAVATSTGVASSADSICELTKAPLISSDNCVASSSGRCTCRRSAISLRRRRNSPLCAIATARAGVVDVRKFRGNIDLWAAPVVWPADAFAKALRLK